MHIDINLTFIDMNVDVNNNIFHYIPLYFKKKLTYMGLP